MLIGLPDVLNIQNFVNGKKNFRHGTPRSAGGAGLLCNFSSDVMSGTTDANRHWLEQSYQFKFILVNVYGYNKTKDNRSLMGGISSHFENN